jgi:hypothetical protein
MRRRAVWAALMTEVFAFAVVEAGQALVEPAGLAWVDSLEQVWSMVRARALPEAAIAARTSSPTGAERDAAAEVGWGLLACSAAGRGGLQTVAAEPAVTEIRLGEPVGFAVVRDVRAGFEDAPVGSVAGLDDSVETVSSQAGSGAAG